MPDQPPSTPERRPYTSPTLEVLGTFSNITAGIGSVCFGPGCIRTNSVFDVTGFEPDDLF